MNSNRISLVGVIIAALLLPAAGTQAVVRYVALDGSGEDGMSWETAYLTIQAAIDDPLVVGGSEIWIKQGTYPLTKAIEVRKAIRIYGGFSGTGSTRNWTLYQTTVNGASRAAHCFYVNGNATIDGIAIVRGTGLAEDPNGAGLLVDNRTATITNCLFSNNVTTGFGGGIATYKADGTKIANCLFNSNQVSGCGAGIYNQGGTGLQILSCSFSGNWTNDSGAGIYNRNCSVTINGCVFQGNRTAEEETCVGGAIWNEGGSPTILNCSFLGNRAAYGAGIYNAASNATIRDCWFARCDTTTLGGGGICNDGGSPTIQGCLFEDNLVAYQGGAILDVGSGAKTINCIMLRNAARRGGGGIYVLDNGGGGSAPSPRFINCTLYGNHTTLQGGGVSSEDTPSTFINCIIWGNSASSGDPGIHSDAGWSSGKPAAHHCDIQGSSVYPGAGNLQTDPRLVDPDTNDVTLLYGSPCIDAGDNAAVAGITVDYDNATRVVDGDGNGTATVDMGACEIQVAAHNLVRGKIQQAIAYGSPSDSSPTYVHTLRLETDGTVTSVEFQPPHDSAWYTIPSDEHTSDGNVDTYHTVQGKTHVWEYVITANDLAALAKFDGGLYTIVPHYWNGAKGQTQVNYVVPGTSSALPQPTQKPQISAPADGATLGAPVTISWGACTDSAVNHIYVTVVDAESGAEAAHEVLAASATSSGRLMLGSATFNAEVGFARLYSDVASTDGTPFECSKAVIVGLGFKVPYSAVYRFWAPATNLHFYTADESEKDKLIEQYSKVWTFEKVAFNACSTATDSRMLPVYRFWSGVAHFYTIDEEEKEKLINEYAKTWNFEGVVFYAYPEGAEPPECKAVYRFWNTINSTHFFTIDEKEADKIMSQYKSVYTYEGVAFYAYPP